MKIWKVILATLVIFTAGILTGAVVSRLASRTRPPLWRLHEAGDKKLLPPGSNRETARLTMPFSRPPARALARDFLERLDRELKLQPEQHRRIQKILEESQKRNKEIWEKIEPEVREEMKCSREEIRGLLTSEQRKHLDELMKRPAKAAKAAKESPASNNAVPPPAENSSAPSSPVPTEPPARL